MRFEPIVELTLGGRQVDISADVTGRGDGFRITRGRANEAGSVAPSACEFELNNTSGRYSPRNPYGPYYKTLIRNTPVRVCTRELRDTFDRTVINGWGTAPGDHVWHLVGSGGTVTNGEWQVNDGAGTIAVPVVGGVRRAYFSDVEYGDVDISAVVRLNVVPSGAAIEVVNLTLRGNTAPLHYVAYATVTPANQIYLGIRFGGTSAVVIADSVYVADYATGQPLLVRVQMEGETIRAKAVMVANGEPDTWHVTGRDATLTRGQVGIQCGVPAGNANALPVVVTVDSFEVRSPRFSGELSSLPPRWDITGRAAWVPVEAGGITRRLARNDAPLHSPPQRQATRNVREESPFYYWSFEDDSSTAAGSELYGRTSPFTPTWNSAAKFGEGVLAPWLPNTVAIPDASSIAPFYMNFPFTTEYGAEFVAAIAPGANLAFEVYPAITGYASGMSLSAPLNRVSFHVGVTTLVLQVMSWPINDGLPHHYRWDVAYVSASSISYKVYVDGVLIKSGVATDVYWVNPDTIRAMSFNMTGASTTPSAVGHVALFLPSQRSSDTAASYRAVMGWVGETAGRRIQRLCSEGVDETSAFDTIPFDAIGDLDASARMGAQPTGSSFLGLLQECAEADAGVLYEQRGVPGLAYRTRYGMSNQTPKLGLNYGAHELTAPWEPTEDDQRTLNNVRARLPKGGTEARAEQTTGPLSVSAVGRYQTQVSPNLLSDTQLLSYAQWMVRLGTVDEARFPRIGVNRARQQIRTNAALSTKVLDLSIGDCFTIANADPINIYGILSQLMLGYEERVDQYQHSFVYNCAPESPYQVLQLDSTPYGRMESANTRLALPLDAVSTSLVADVGGYSIGARPYVNAALWTTDPSVLPLGITVDDEEMLTTAIAGDVPTFVGVGAAVHGVDVASLTPPLPDGTRPGDLLLVFAAIRDTGVVLPVPDGYATLGVVASNANLFGRMHSGVESPPLVQFPAAVAGSDVSAQVAAFRGVTAQQIGFSTASGTAQNVLVGTAELATESRNLLVVYAGWKQDDWTSVAALAGATRIDAQVSTAGNDQGLVWDYRVYTNQTPPFGTLPAQTYTVTGGVAAPYLGRQFAFVPRVQTMTVQRGLNNIVQPHPAGSRIRFTRPSAIGR